MTSLRSRVLQRMVNALKQQPMTYADLVPVVYGAHPPSDPQKCLQLAAMKYGADLHKLGFRIVRPGPGRGRTTLRLERIKR